jgi:hypothetical protein
MKWLSCIEFLKRRSLVVSSLVLAPMLVLILGLMACVKHPVGDPERSQVCPQYTGMWLGEDAQGTATLLMLRPYDARTYLLGIFSHRDEGHAIKPLSHQDGKAWLTTLGDSTFITMEPLVWSHFAGFTEKPPYLVAKISRVEDTLRLRLVDGGKALARAAADSREFEAIVKEHQDSDSLYEDQEHVFHQVRATPRVEAILKAFRPTDFPGS